LHSTGATLAATDLSFLEADRERDKLRISRVLLCAALLAPISLTLFNDGVSANYLFAILLISPLGYRDNYHATAYILFMLLSLAVGAVMFSHLDAFFLMRQFISFSLMLLGVCLLYVRMGIRLEEFLVAVVVCAVAYSLTAFYMFTYGGFSLTDIYNVKGGMREFITDWPQRYVVVLVFAFFVALRRWNRGIIWPIADVVILTCIFLTFTRAAWVGVAVGLVAYGVLLLTGRVQKATAGSRNKQTVAVFAGLALALAALSYAVLNPNVSSAFGTIYDDLVDVSQTNPQDFNASEGEGERLDLYSQIIKTVEGNPFTGTGFAGAYLVIAGEGSAHGQYWDVLLRTGVIGLVIYMLFWGKLLKHYIRTDAGVAAGLIALLIFGIFHETTKLSYGALIFFFLLNKAYAAQVAGGGPPRAGA
jgi:hypothetical protein